MCRLTKLEIKAVPLISNTGFFYLHFVAKFSGVLNFYYPQGFKRTNDMKVRRHLGKRWEGWKRYMTKTA